MGGNGIRPPASPSCRLAIRAGSHRASVLTAPLGKESRRCAAFHDAPNALSVPNELNHLNVPTILTFSNCLPNKIREHENPVHVLFRVNKRFQIFSQATEIKLGASQKQSVTQLFFISDGHFSIQIIKIHPGFSQQENNVKKVAAHRPAAAKNT